MAKMASGSMDAEFEELSVLSQSGGMYLLTEKEYPLQFGQNEFKYRERGCHGYFMIATCSEQ